VSLWQSVLDVPFRLHHACGPEDPLPPYPLSQEVP
jgi:hypothetical protein